MSAQKEYPADGIVVGWEPARCIHAEACIRGLPDVFDPERRPWIDPSGTDGAVLAEVIRRCPSGALTYRSTGPSVGPERHDEVRVRVVPGGPLAVVGTVLLVDGDGEEIDSPPRATLCRCGGTSNSPFCDGTHRRNGFSG